MGVMVYKENEKPLRIEPWEMEGYLSMGWSLDENPIEPAPENTAPVDLDEPDLGLKEPAQNDDESFKMAVLQYEEKFGEKPHHRMKLETILEKLNGNEPVQPE